MTLFAFFAGDFGPYLDHKFDANEPKIVAYSHESY